MLLSCCVIFLTCDRFGTIWFLFYHAFLCRKDAGTQKAPGEPWAALQGQVLCTGVPHTDAQALFNFNEVGIDRQSLLLLRCRQRDVQDAILKLCVDVLLLHGVTHIEAAGAGTGESLAAQITALFILLVIGVAADGLNGQVTIVDVVLLNKAIAGKVTLSEQAFLNADCGNVDQVLDEHDLNALMQYLVGIVQQLPGEAK